MNILFDVSEVWFFSFILTVVFFGVVFIMDKKYYKLHPGAEKYLAEIDDKLRELGK